MAKALPWLQYSAEVDRQIEAGKARERAAGFPAVTVVNGALSYSDAGPKERYIVGYGGERNYQAPAPRPAVNGASDKQKELIDKLLLEREHNYTEADVEAAKADWRKTRKMIDFLLSPTTPRRKVQAPVVAAPAAPVRTRLNFAEIPNGNYAVGTDTDGDPIKFYRVSTSKKGFKNVQVRASDELFPLFGSAGIAVLHKIVALGIKESQMLFSTSLERCYTCYRTLTDQVSRERGQGPECCKA